MVWRISVYLLMFFFVKYRNMIPLMFWFNLSTSWAFCPLCVANSLMLLFVRSVFPLDVEKICSFIRLYDFWRSYSLVKYLLKYNFNCYTMFGFEQFYPCIIGWNIKYHRNKLETIVMPWKFTHIHQINLPFLINLPYHYWPHFELRRISWCIYKLRFQPLFYISYWYISVMFFCFLEQLGFFSISS